MTFDLNAPDRDTCSECPRRLKLSTTRGRPRKTCGAKCARARYLRMKRFQNHVRKIKASAAEKAHLEEFGRWARGEVPP